MQHTNVSDMLFDLRDNRHAYDEHEHQISYKVKKTTAGIFERSVMRNII